MLTALAAFLVPALVGIYTCNYGRWAWQQGLRWGAVGLYLLAAATVVVPISLFLMLR